jgi:hypothetical protein
MPGIDFVSATLLTLSALLASVGGDEDALAGESTQLKLHICRIFSLQRDQFAGVYKDDPGKVAPEECRALAGVVLDEESAKASGLPSMTYPAQQTLQTTFPYLGFLSILLGVSKVYPALDRHCEGDPACEGSYGECLEIYDRPAKSVTFHAIKKSLRK